MTLDKTISPELRREGMAREVIRHIQAARKNAGLNVDDRITLSLHSEDEELEKAILEHKATILAETLAENMTDESYEYNVDIKVEGAALTLSLEKNS